MKGSWFHKDTGKFLHHGKSEDPKGQGLAQAGHIFVSDVTSTSETPLKYDFSLGQVVVDQEILDNRTAYENDMAQRLQDAQDAYDRLQTASFPGNPDLQQAVADIVTIFRRTANYLER